MSVKGDSVMRLGEYMDKNNLDYDDVILKTEDGKVIVNPGCLIDNCEIIEVTGNELIIR